MKMFKRFAAALLAGVMVLAMLTACGGSSPSLAKQAEDALMKSLNSQLKPEEQYENDPVLYNKIYDALGKIKEDGTLAVEDYPEDAQIEAPTKDGVYVTYVLTDSNGKAREVKSVDADGGVHCVATQSGDKKVSIQSIDKIAVAAREVNGKTYLGYALEVTVKMVDAETPSISE